MTAVTTRNDYDAVKRNLHASVSYLAELGRLIEDHLVEEGFQENAEVRQTFSLNEEAGEFFDAIMRTAAVGASVDRLTGTVRRYYGWARRSDTLEHVYEELADVIITAFVTAAALRVPIADAVVKKTEGILTRGRHTP